MSAIIQLPKQRNLLAATAAAGALDLIPGTLRAAVGDASIRPFRVNVSEEQLVDLRRRIAATRWPDRETVSDRSQGVRLAKLQELDGYWATECDCRKGGLREAGMSSDGVLVERWSSDNGEAWTIVLRHPNGLGRIASSGTTWIPIEPKRKPVLGTAS